jgi:hypothetical protein
MIARLIRKPLLGDLVKRLCGIAKNWRTSWRHCSAANPSRGNRGGWDPNSDVQGFLTASPFRTFIHLQDWHSQVAERAISPKPCGMAPNPRERHAAAGSTSVQILVDEGAGSVAAKAQMARPHQAFV